MPDPFPHRRSSLSLPDRRQASHHSGGNYTGERRAAERAVQMELDLPMAKVELKPVPNLQVSRMPDGSINIKPRMELRLEGTVAEAAAILGVSVVQVRLMIRSGELRAYRPGKRKYIVDLLHAQQIKEESRVGRKLGREQE